MVFITQKQQKQKTMKNPILGNILNGVLNTALSVVRDKKVIDRTNDSKALVNIAPEKGINLSSTRVFGYGTGGVLIGLAISLIEKDGAQQADLIILGVGAALTIATQVLTYLKEKPTTPKQ